MPWANVALDEFIASLPAQKDPRATADFIPNATEGGRPAEMSDRAFSLPNVSPETESTTEVDKARRGRIAGAGERTGNAEGTAEKETGLHGWGGEPDKSGVFQEAPARASQLAPSSSLQSTTDFALLAAHAGLILLHPFLPRFFESTGLKEKPAMSLRRLAYPAGPRCFITWRRARTPFMRYDLLFIKGLAGSGSGNAALCFGRIDH